MRKASIVDVLLFNRNDLFQFELIYKKYFKEMLYLARSIVKNPDDAYDIVSQAYVNLIRKKNKEFKTEMNIRYELRVITRNLAISYLRRANRLEDIITEISYTQEIANPIADLGAIKTGVIAKLQEQFEKLPPQQRQVIVMKYVKGMSRQQIAEALNISPETAKNNLQKGIKKLRKYLPPGQMDTLIVIIIIILTWKN